MVEKKMNSYMHYTQSMMETVTFPDVALRNVAHFVNRNEMYHIPGHKAVVDQNNDHTFAIVKDGYKPVQHREVIALLDSVCNAFPEYGEPTKEMWLSNQMGRMRVRYTFKETNFEIRPGDSIHPTFDAYASHDTSLAQRFDVGAWRLLCTNGMKIGKEIANYKRKHVESLDLDVAKAIVSGGMKAFSKAQDLLVSFTERQAIASEVFMYEAIPFSSVERFDIEAAIKRVGHVITWDDKEPENRKVEINAYDLLNIYTDVASHNIMDMNRQLRVDDAIANTFMRVRR